VDLSFTHYRILYEADSSSLPELLTSTKSYGSPDGDFEWPPLSVQEARQVLVDLIAAGYVDVLGESGRTLSKAEATEAIRSDPPWINTTPDTPDYYEIGITDEGTEVFKLIHPQFRTVGLISDG
jgi:hypothetical protein